MKKTISKKFTFKADPPTGRYRSFHKTFHEIKFEKKVVGQIIEESPYSLRLMVEKNDINEDGNTNCSWKWITFKAKFESLDKAKIWINEKRDSIRSQFRFHHDD